MNSDEIFTHGKEPFMLMVSQLLEWQKILWSLLKENYSALANIKMKSFWFNGLEVRAQFNPGRIISSSADLSKEIIEKRPCFLCAQNLPPEQIWLRLNDYNVLCNPYPIFEEHFTIACINHNPQSITENLDAFLTITQLLGEKYTLLYNGPACGASAPDHLHFQAVTKNEIPIENDLANESYKFSLEAISCDGVNISFVKDSLRKFVLLTSAQKENLISLLNIFLSSYKDAVNTPDEPMMNIISWYREGKWSVLIFPRQKHRPRQFFLEGPDRLLISPAVVDLGGLLIIPREEDFAKISSEIIADIFHQVIIDEERFQKLIEVFRKSVGGKLN